MCLIDDHAAVATNVLTLSVIVSGPGTLSRRRHSENEVKSRLMGICLGVGTYVHPPGLPQRL